MKQKLLCLLAALAFLLPARLSAFNYKYEGVTLRYEVIDEDAKACMVSGYKDFSGALVIPDVANDGTSDYSVTAIGEEVFKNFKDMTSVVIGNSVTSIGNGAFGRCSGLTSVEIPNSVTSIGKSAFQGCIGLNSVEIGNSVQTIGSSAFYECMGLTSVEIPNSVQTIGSSAFCECKGLTSVVIPNSVTSIDSSVFSDCSGLKSVVIPNSVTSIGKRAFYGCSGLTSVVIPNSVQTIGSSAFYGCSGLTSVVIGYSVTEIGSQAFYGCIGLTSVVIPNSVTSIDGKAFDGCNGITYLEFNAENCESAGSYDYPVFPNSLDTVVFGDKVTTIPDYLFYKCEKLKSVEIPDSVKSIGSSAFSGCSGLISVVLGSSVTSIGSCAFSGCSGLKSVEIPNSVQTIGSIAFYRCSGLTSVVIGNSVTEIGESAFRDCSGLTSVVIPNSVTEIGESAFRNCSGLTSMVIPNSVTSIGMCAFADCSGLTSVEIGNSVTSIGYSAFSECSLTSVVIPNSVTSIGDSAFENCNIDTIIMGYGVKSIGDKAFRSCPASRIYITAQTPPKINSNTFDNYKGMLYLQGQAAVNAYDDDKYWGNFNNELMTVPTALEIEGLTSISGNAGDTFRINAKMTPEDVTLPYILWRSTNTKIATVDHNGVVTLQEYSAEDLTRAEGDEDNDGTCSIIAESLYFDGPIAEIVVNNTGMAAASIALDESNLDLKVGQSAKLTATVKNVEDNTVTWTSSDDAVATVDAEGNVTAVAVGEADITATCGSVSASCKVTVTAILAETITISQESWSAHPGETVKLTTTVLPENTTDKTVTWTSSNDDVATVDAEGNVTAVAVGEADITATCGSVSASCKVTVTPILVESLTIDPTAWSGVEGSEFTIKATVLPENADDKTLTFESSDSSVATVDAEGNVKVLKEGTCVITVSTVDGSDLKAECVVTGLSGVEAIFADPNASVDVYDMNGVMMKKGCSREELRQLKPAVYILRSGETVVKVLQK